MEWEPGWDETQNGKEKPTFQPLTTNIEHTLQGIEETIKMLGMRVSEQATQGLVPVCVVHYPPCCWEQGFLLSQICHVLGERAVGMEHNQTAIQ